MIASSRGYVQRIQDSKYQRIRIENIGQQILEDTYREYRIASSRGYAQRIQDSKYQRIRIENIGKQVLEDTYREYRIASTRGYVQRIQDSKFQRIRIENIGQQVLEDTYRKYRIASSRGYVQRIQDSKFQRILIFHTQNYVQSMLRVSGCPANRLQRDTRVRQTNKDSSFLQICPNEIAIHAFNRSIKYITGEFTVVCHAMLCGNDLQTQ